MDSDKFKETASKSLDGKGFRVEKNMSKTSDASTSRSSEPVIVPIDQNVALDGGSDNVAPREKVVKPSLDEKKAVKSTKSVKVVQVNTEKQVTKNGKQMQIAVKDGDTKDEAQQPKIESKKKEGKKVEKPKAAEKSTKEVAKASVAQSSQLAIVKKDKALPAKMSDVAGSRARSGAKNTAKKTSAVTGVAVLGGASQRRMSMDMVGGGTNKAAKDVTSRDTDGLKAEQKTSTASVETDAKKEGKKRFEKPFSKPKAFLLAAIVTLLVGLVGGLLVWAFSPKAPQYCLVQFESNGGSLIEDVELVCGETVEKPEDPSKEGFDFKDWLYEGKSFGFGKTKVNQDMILIAEWSVIEGTEVVTVSFDSDGGSEIKPIELAKGSTTPAPITPTRDGYAFVGWFLDDMEFTFADPIENDITLKARWEKVETPTQGEDRNERPNNRPQEPSKPSDNTQPKPKVTGLSASNREVTAGSTLEILIGVTPATAEYNLSVMSSDTRVAHCAVSQKNKLDCGTMSLPGSATITVRDEISGNAVSFTITVKPTTVSVVSVAINGIADGAVLKVGDSLGLTVSVTPENATNKTAVWSTSNAGVVTVDGSGYVSAVGVGSATITVTVGGKSASVTINVEANETPEPPAPDGDGAATSGN